MDEKKQSLNPNLVFAGIIVLVIVGILVLSGSNPRQSGGSGSTIALPICPSDFECCDSSEYQDKLCSLDYECRNFQCEPIDSDKDGLYDFEEKEFGSNPYQYDSDSDGLNDKAEFDLKSDPNDRNTDDDRYDDAEDKEPTKKNNPVIKASVISKDWDLELTGIIEGIKNLDLDFPVATLKANVQLENTGDDYTDWIKFDNVFTVQGSEHFRKSESITRLDPAATETAYFEYVFTVSEIPSWIINIIQTQESEWNFQVQNLRYQKY